MQPSVAQPIGAKTRRGLLDEIELDGSSCALQVGSPSSLDPGEEVAGVVAGSPLGWRAIDDDDGWILVDVGGELMRYRNHDPARLRLSVGRSGGHVRLTGWDLLRAPAGAVTLCICVATEATPYMGQTELHLSIHA